LREAAFGKLLSPARRRRCIEHVRQTFQVSERFACRVLGQHRSTQRKVPRGRSDEEALTADIIALAAQYGRYGYRRITALLREAGWAVNVKRVERIWRREGLKVPAKQPKKGRLWLNDGSCIRLRPERPNHVWSYDFVEARTHDGRKFRMLNLIDEFTRECLAIRVARSSVDGRHRRPGGPVHAPRGAQRTSGPTTARVHRHRGAGLDHRRGRKDRLHRAGSPWENGYCESFNSKLRDELLDGRSSTASRSESRHRGWRQHYNTKRPHSSLGYRPPAPEVVQWPASPPGAASPATPPWRQARHALRLNPDHPMGAGQAE
jgi:transposase InsO family protein